MQIHSKAAHDSFVVESDGGRYEVFVNLPVTYGQRPDARYPVLYMLDGNLLFGNVCDAVRVASLARTLFPNLTLHGAGTPEMIVVGIGYPGTDPMSVAREAVTRRIYDYTARTVPESPLQQHCLAVSPNYKFGGAKDFLRLVTETIRAKVEEAYRVDSSQRIIFGGSAAGHFTTYTLLNAPEAFTHYIIASPAVELCGDDLYEQEAAYAATHDDLPVSVFISFGSRELEGMASISVASSTTRLAESLLKRGYPNLKLHTCILQGEPHEGAIQAALPRAIEALLAG